MSNPLAAASFEARSARLRMARAELLPLTETLTDIMNEHNVGKMFLPDLFHYHSYGIS